MSIALSKEEARLLIELAADPRWKVLEGILQRRLDHAHRNLEDLRDIHQVAAEQGRARELRELLDLRSRSLKVLTNAQVDAGTARS